VQQTDSVLVLDTEPASAGEIGRRLINGGVELTELTPVHLSLEEVFLELVESKG
jgi:hypothetical protein